MSLNVWRSRIAAKQARAKKSKIYSGSKATVTFTGPDGKKITIKNVDFSFEPITEVVLSKPKKHVHGVRSGSIKLTLVTDKTKL